MQSTEKKKILYVITKSNWGGAQRYVYDLATELSKKDNFNVSVALGGNGVLKSRLEEKNISVTPLCSLQRDVHLLNDVRVFFELISLFKKEQFDIIHLNSSKIGVMGGLAARIAGCKNILFTAHGWAHTEDRPVYQKIIIKFLHWLTIILSHTTIAVSEMTKKELSGTPFVSKKLVVVYNGVTEPNFYTREEARGKILGDNGVTNTTLMVGTIAELHKNKGLTYAIEAFSQIVSTRPDTHFIIIGSGEEKNSLHFLVQTKNLQKHITFFENNEANQYLNAFDIFILPSIKEGLPYTILEAGAAHLPVIASHIGGIPEIVTHNATGLLSEPRDIDQIKTFLTILLEDKDLRKELGEKLYTHVQKNFSTDTMVEKTLQYYNKR
ncbi:MAG: glycosyltransferase family 4 protein [Candidatus Pacebacteria bacterium]|nr:glycosyltransferase family 4 protein [Candidatus Paceibacterota bacterium]